MDAPEVWITIALGEVKVRVRSPRDLAGEMIGKAMATALYGVVTLNRYENAEEDGGDLIPTVEGTDAIN